MADWTLPADAVPLFRLIYLLGCFAATWLGVHFLQPSQAARKAAVVAGGVQLCLGIILDSCGVRYGLWRYQVQAGLVLEVPLDMHLAWALLCGVLYAVGSPRPKRAALGYGILWWLATVTVDFMGASRIMALLWHKPGLGWFVADAAIVGGLLLLTLWIYRSVLAANQALAAVSKHKPKSHIEAQRGGAGLRAGLYLVTFGSIVFLYVPQQILQWSGRSLWPLPTFSLVARGGWLALIGLPLLWAVWAVLEFRAAAGTPLPYDPPQRLVTSGPYAFVRNPMQLGVVLGIAGLAGYYRSWLLLLYALDLALLSEVLFERYETPELFARFGADYVHYRQHVRRWLPHILPYAPPQPPLLTIAYDAHCAGCVSLVAWLKTLALVPLQFEPLPTSATAVRLLVHAPEQKEVVAKYEGFAACLQILRRCPLYLAWVLPVCELWPLRSLFHLAYRAIAETRVRNSCAVGRDFDPAKSKPM